MRQFITCQCDFFEICKLFLPFNNSWFLVNGSIIPYLNFVFHRNMRKRSERKSNTKKRRTLNLTGQKSPSSCRGYRTHLYYPLRDLSFFFDQSVIRFMGSSCCIDCFRSESRWSEGSVCLPIRGDWKMSSVRKQCQI